MEPIPVRLWEDDKDALEAEAADKNISVSAYTRDLLQKGRAFDAQEHEDVLRKYTVSSENQRKVSQLRAMTLRVESSTRTRLEEETADSEASLSEHIRGLIARGRAQAEVLAQEQQDQRRVNREAPHDDTDNTVEESQQQSDESDTDAISVELTLSPDTKEWLEEQTVDSDLTVPEYIQQLIATARKDDLEPTDSTKSSTQQIDETTLTDRLATLETEHEELRKLQTDSEQDISELRQRVAALETAITQSIGDETTDSD